MVPWWKRLMFSLVSLLVAAPLCMAGLAAVSMVNSHDIQRLRGSELLLMAAMVLGFCMVAWALSSPVVLLVSNYRGWRFWFYLALGSVAGPVLMLGMAAGIYFYLPHAPGAVWLTRALLPAFYVAGALSTLTSLFYLLLERRSLERARRQLRA